MCWGVLGCAGCALVCWLCSAKLAVLGCAHRARLCSMRSLFSGMLGCARVCSGVLGCARVCSPWSTVIAVLRVPAMLGCARCASIGTLVRVARQQQQMTILAERGERRCRHPREGFRPAKRITILAESGELRFSDPRECSAPVTTIKER